MHLINIPYIASTLAFYSDVTEFDSKTWPLSILLYALAQFEDFPNEYVTIEQRLPNFGNDSPLYKDHHHSWTKTKSDIG